MDRKSMAIVLLAVGLAARDSGPSDSAFVAACMKEGETAAGRAMRREMAIKGEEFCSCAAGVARKELSADARHAMVLGMEGKTSEANAMAAKFSDADQMAFMKGGMTMLERCAMPGRR